MKRARKHNAQTGFTLIELLVVIAIIGTLAALLFPAVRGAILASQTAATGQDGKQLWMGLFIEDTEREQRGMVSVFPSTGDYDNSTDFFRDCITSNWLDSAFTFHFMGAPGLPRNRTDDPTRFDTENNAWCVVLDLYPGSKGAIPFMFTRNLAGHGSTIDTIDTLTETQKPFGDQAGVIITVGGAVKIIKAKDVQSNNLQEYFNPTLATNSFIRP